MGTGVVWWVVGVVVEWWVVVVVWERLVVFGRWLGRWGRRVGECVFVLVLEVWSPKTAGMMDATGVPS